MHAARQRSWSSDQESGYCNGNGTEMLPTSASTQSLRSIRQRRPKRGPNWLRANVLGLLLLAAATLIAGAVFYALHQSAKLQHEDAQIGGSLRRSARMLSRSDRVDLKTLVIYVYSGSDPEYEENLRYFLRTGVKVCPALLGPTTVLHSMQAGSLVLQLLAYASITATVAHHV